MPTALLSVYHKDGIVDFAQELIQLGWEIVASGGTAKALSEAGISVVDVADFVGGSPILGHRVATLSRKIHAALLSRDIPEDNEELAKLGIPRIDLVCVDLYPLEKEIEDTGATHESVIEQTDIGGPTLLRSAAKGGRIVICDPVDREKVVNWLKEGKPQKQEFILALAAKAESLVARYCLISATYLSKESTTGFIGEKANDCKYGENPWQESAALYSTNSDDPLAIHNFEQVAGADPGYVNFCDIDRLLQTITHIAAGFETNFNEKPLIAVACKHGNPIGAAIGDDSLEVLKKMTDGDPLSIFGGFVITNFSIGEEEAEVLRTYNTGDGPKRLLDGVIAPSLQEKAIVQLQRKKGACKLLANPALKDLGISTLDAKLRFRHVRGGFLQQPNYEFLLRLSDPEISNLDELTSDQKRNLILAWAIGSTSNSNTITLVRDGHLIGNGVAQPARVHAAELAVHRAITLNHVVKGSIAYSDSFFPFPDGPKVLAGVGVEVIFASSGSIRDKDVITYCKKQGVILCLYPDRLGRGFFNH